MIINKRMLQKTLAKQVPKAIGPRVFKELEMEFEKAKKALLNEFENHEVTRELNQGASGSNISDTLAGEGNLYAFIGFGGEDALSALRLVLRDSIKIINKKTNARNLTFSIRVSLPTASQIAAATPMPWAPGMSWAEGIEKGISGLGQFLSKKTPASRSGEGIQIDFSVRQGEFSPRMYITEILQNFVKSLSSI